jgi:alpha-aminoadipate carrier protein LysW
MLKCPVCDAELEIDDEELDEGDTITCDECGADLRVVSTDPLELESLEEEEEEEETLDFDEEEDEDDDEDWK